MVTITVNYNDDVIMIDDDKTREPITHISWKRPNTTLNDVTKILGEVINACHGQEFVTLQVIDEDRRIGIGEW